MAIPRPGKPVRGSRTGRPVMALLDLLGRRWVMRIIWELRDDAVTFRELRERCDAISPTVLNQRLHELREAGIVEIAEVGGYSLSSSGMELSKFLKPLLQWSERWQRSMAAKDGN